MAYIKARLILIAFLITCARSSLSPLLDDLDTTLDLEVLVVDLMNGMIRHGEVNSVAIFCDTVYLKVFEGALFKRIMAIPYFMIVVDEYEDLLSPNFDTLESIRQARRDGSNAYIILLANGLQTSRLLKFGDRHRIIDTRAKFIILHDFRLFGSEMHYIWKRIVNVVFVRQHSKIIRGKITNSWFDLTTVPFPSPIRTVLVPRRLDTWRNGRFYSNNQLFADKSKDLNGQILNVVYLEHVPALTFVNNGLSSTIGGLEIEDGATFHTTSGILNILHERFEGMVISLRGDINWQPRSCDLTLRDFIILNTLAKSMNFVPHFYEPMNAALHRWGQKQINGSFSGLLGEMVNGKADVALGNLQYTPYHLQLTDLTIPYIAQCLTFLTPEALTDNSWKTLILPFKLYMWVTVLLMLLITGLIFYALANYHLKLLKFYNTPQETPKVDQLTSSKLMNEQKELETKPIGLYLFSELTNSILYTYSMLVVVSLPKLPTGWSIRLLTGCYWLYCILLVVSYRASMTAILANPAPRVTIDTLAELVDSKITCGGWGTETKQFFLNSMDEATKKIGERFETTNDPDGAVTRVARGLYAYYDNKYFLKYISVKRQNQVVNGKDMADNTTRNETHSREAGMDRNLHIMSDCVVNIPISLGLQKNSPLKPRSDKYLRRIIEVGLVEKWLNDVMQPIRTAEIANDDEIKALMNLRKLYGAFIALGIGYFLAAVCLVGELIQWHCVTKKDPKFDKYAMDVFYSRKKP